jgi:hypothetical protein
MGRVQVKVYGVRILVLNGLEVFARHWQLRKLGGDKKISRRIRRPSRKSNSNNRWKEQIFNIGG